MSAPEFARAKYEIDMSLRDWIAGQALAGIMANRQIGGEDAGLASYAYRMADAMLTERAKATTKECGPPDESCTEEMHAAAGQELSSL